MDAPKILETDSLRNAYPKLNSAIDNSNEALSTANTAKSAADGAVTTANEANTKSDDTQQQLNNIVINNGESDAEVLQARGSYSVLNERLSATDEQLAEKASKSDITNLDTKKADITYVDSQVQQVSLAWKESYSTLADLQTAYPSGDNFNHTVLADGMIYTWNTNTLAWENTNIQANGTGVPDNTLTPSKNTFNSDMNLVIHDEGELTYNPATYTLSNTKRMNVFAHGKLININAGSVDFSATLGSAGSAIYFVYANFDPITSTSINISDLKIAVFSSSLVNASKKIVIIGSIVSNKFLPAQEKLMTSNNSISPKKMTFNSDMNFSLHDTGKLSWNNQTKLLSNTGDMHLFAHGKLATINAGSKDFSSSSLSGVSYFYVNYDFVNATSGQIAFSDIQVTTFASPNLGADKRIIILGSLYNGEFIPLKFKPSNASEGTKQVLSKDTGSLLDAVEYDKPLYKIALFGDSIFEHKVPKYNEIPTAAPNRYLGEGELGTKSEPTGEIPPHATTNNTYRLLYEKFRDHSENPTSIKFNDFTKGVYTGTWSTITQGSWNYDYKRTTEALSSVEFTIPSGVENMMLIYTREIGGGKADVTIDGVSPSTIAGLGNNNTVRDWSKPDLDIAPLDKVDFGYVDPNDATWCNGNKSLLNTEVYSGLDPSTSHTFKVTKENDTLPIELWGVAFWTGTFIWIVNKAYGGHEIRMLKPYAYQDIYLQEMDFVIGKGHSLNDYSKGLTHTQLPTHLKEYADKMKEWGKSVGFMSGIPFGKRYSTDAEWTDHNGENYQYKDYGTGTGLPKDTEIEYRRAVLNLCNTEGYYYIPTYEAFLNKVYSSNNKDITTGETMGQIYQKDGQHLREKGCFVMSRAIWNSVSKPLKELKD